VLLDEGVPRHLAGPLDAAGFSTTPYPNVWKQMANGELLALAEEQGFDVLVTNDRNIYAQQNLQGRKLKRIEPGQYVVIEPTGSRPVIDYNAPEAETTEMPSIQPLKFK
jgi:hypothetical protein